MIINFRTYIGSGYFFGFKILNFNFIFGFQKTEYFWGMTILWIFFSGGVGGGGWVSSQHWTIFRGNFYAF